MKDTYSIDSFYNRVVGIINQLKSHGENIEYQRVVEKVLRILSQKFESLVMTLEENKDMSSLPLMSYKPHSSIVKTESVDQTHH